MEKSLQQVLAMVSEKRSSFPNRSKSTSDQTPHKRVAREAQEWAAGSTERLTRFSEFVALLGKLSPDPITTVGDLLVVSEPHIMQVLDIGMNEASQFLDFIAQAICPSFVQVDKLALQSGNVPIGIPGLDASLRGGIRGGLITELVGKAGVGKTQFCMSLTALVASRGEGVLYIDTENRFQSSRLAEIYTSRAGLTDRVSWDSAAEQVVVVRPSSTTQVLEALQNAETLIIKKSIGLIVLDSVAMLAKLNFGARKDIFARQDMLSRQASQMKYLAEMFNIPVVVTNQVAGGSRTVGATAAASNTVYDSDVHPALGNTWSHCVNVRLNLEKHTSTNSNSNMIERRRIVIEKSPCCGTLAFGYTITESGIENKEYNLNDFTDDTEQFLLNIAPNALQALFDD